MGEAAKPGHVIIGISFASDWLKSQYICSGWLYSPSNHFGHFAKHDCNFERVVAAKGNWLFRRMVTERTLIVVCCRSITKPKGSQNRKQSYYLY